MLTTLSGLLETFTKLRGISHGADETYTIADAKAAIDLAEGHKFSSFSMVWGGNDSHYQNKDIVNPKTGVLIKTVTKYQPPPDESEKVSDDTGHTLRNHVKGHQAAPYVGAKSRYEDLPTCLGVTAEALNSDKGRQALQAMDADPGLHDRKIRVDVTGAWYGDASDDVKKKIKDVTVIFMRLGTDTLWIHTSYPTGFVT